MNFNIIWIATMLYFMTEMNCDEVNIKVNPPEVVPQSLFHDWENVHGYIRVRPEAYIFYWLFYADGTRVNATDKPLIIWIQGGPGFAASGIGNFAEIGPFNMNMQPRNHTWVKERNVLFIDHPVGTGFSYVTNSSQYVTTDQQLAIDLSRVIKVFYRRHKVFRSTPTYLVGQSYGGKACPRVAYYLNTAIEKKSLKMNLKGIGIGGGWVNPKESSAMQAPYLYFMGAIDRNLYIASSKLAKKLERSLAHQNMGAAAALDSFLFSTLNEARVINFNNVYAESPYTALNELSVKINNYIKPMLSGVNQTRSWEYLSYIAYESLKENFLLPSTSFLEALLNNTNLKVAVYNGNLDAVTPLAGAVNWVHKLRWHGANDFAVAQRHTIPGNGNGFYKTAKTLSFWWVFGAGHWVPEENPEAMEHVLQYLLKDN